MCCQISLQDRVRIIGIFSIIFCIVLTIFGHIHLLVSNESWNLNSTNYLVSCNKSSSIDCNSTMEVDEGQNGVGAKVVLTTFQILVDLPASILLLLGAKTRIKRLLLPWMLLTAIKMLGYVTACCIFVHFILIQILDEKYGFGMKHYPKPTNLTSEQHFSIFSGSVVDNIVHERFPKIMNYTLNP